MNIPPASIRRATAADAPLIVGFLRHMLADMAAVGGHPIATDTEPWIDVEAEFRDHQQSPKHVHLLAERAGTELPPVGWAFARSKDRDPLFEPARVLHIHALYVLPPHRQRGIGRALLEALVEWGRSTGCTEAKLNVLVGNPARSLYSALGFDAFEIEMTRKLKTHDGRHVNAVRRTE